VSLPRSNGTVYEANTRMDVPGGSFMDFPYSVSECKQELPLCFCPKCRAPAFTKGTRNVAQILVDGTGGTYRNADVLRVRLQCRNPDCPQGSWTLYEPGGYPGRRFALGVVVSGVSELAVVPGATLTGVAERLGCDRSTLAVWVTWVAGLGDVEKLSRACAELDPDGLPPPCLPIVASPAGADVPCRVPPGASLLFPLAGLVLILLERLAQLRRRWGQLLEKGPGLVAILGHQLLESGLIVLLPRPSPGKPVSPAASRG